MVQTTECEIENILELRKKLTESFSSSLNYKRLLRSFKGKMKLMVCSCSHGIVDICFSRIRTTPVYGGELCGEYYVKAVVRVRPCHCEDAVDLAYLLGTSGDGNPILKPSKDVMKYVHDNSPFDAEFLFGFVPNVFSAVAFTKNILRTMNETLEEDHCNA